MARQTETVVSSFCHQIRDEAQSRLFNLVVNFGSFAGAAEIAARMRKNCQSGV